MIHESRYWKIPLLRGATYLEKLVVTDENSNAALARAEREVFVGFYAVRKLIQTLKLSSATKRILSPVEWFSLQAGQSVDYFHKSDVDELFDLEHPSHETRDIAFLCNQVIHSYIFLNSITDEGKLNGFFVSSDTMRRRRLYFIGLPVILQIFRAVGRDYPKQMHYAFDETSAEWHASDV